jgi:hypothetical protein
LLWSAAFRSCACFFNHLLRQEKLLLPVRIRLKHHLVGPLLQKRLGVVFASLLEVEGDLPQRAEFALQFPNREGTLASFRSVLQHPNNRLHEHPRQSLFLFRLGALRVTTSG